MSRTIRRKGVVLPEDVVSDWGFGHIIPLTGKELKKSIALYRSDNYYCGCCTGNVPKWYRQILRYNQRSHDRLVLDQINKGNYDDYSFVPWKSDAGYDYW